jgi:hypothetical protein
MQRVRKSKRPVLGNRKSFDFTMVEYGILNKMAGGTQAANG